jgi:pimeloyl-ACP methyl ester carboxylesterase
MTRAKEPTTLVLLPGLDGTDVFFRPLLAALPEWITPLVVQFPTTGANEYPDLLRLVRQAVAKTSAYYVLGWSFAGPLALMLAVTEPGKVRGVILASTFVRPPRRIFARLRWAAVTPMVWMIRAGKRLPVWLSRDPTDRLRRDKTETWKRVGTGMIAARIRTLLNVDARELLRGCPHRVLCIAGSHDRIVPHHNVEEIARVRPSAVVRLIAGRHFAIYTNPKAAADAIAEFMRSQEG